MTMFKFLITWHGVPCDRNTILTRESSDKSGLIRFCSLIYNVEILYFALCYRNFHSFRMFCYFSSTFSSVKFDRSFHRLWKMKISVENVEGLSLRSTKNDFLQVSVIHHIRVTRNGEIPFFYHKTDQSSDLRRKIGRCKIKDPKTIG